MLQTITDLSTLEESSFLSLLWSIVRMSISGKYAVKYKVLKAKKKLKKSMALTRRSNSSISEENILCKIVHMYLY